MSSIGIAFGEWLAAAPALVERDNSARDPTMRAHWRETAIYAADLLQERRCHCPVPGLREWDVTKSLTSCIYAAFTLQLAEAQMARRSSFLMPAADHPTSKATMQNSGYQIPCLPAYPHQHC
jgi:hypothetical protein